MDSLDLSEAQVDASFRQLAPMTHYLCKLKDKMHKRQDPQSKAHGQALSRGPYRGLKKHFKPSSPCCKITSR